VVANGVFCCCSPSASRLCVLWLYKCFAAYLGCNEWLFQSSFSSISLNQSAHSPLTSSINKAFLPTGLPHTGCFFPFSHHSLKWLSVKIPVTEQIVKYSDWPVWHQQPCHDQNCLNHPSFPFFPSNCHVIGLFDNCFNEKFSRCS